MPKRKKARGLTGVPKPDKASANPDVWPTSVHHVILTVKPMATKTAHRLMSRLDIDMRPLPWRPGAPHTR